MRIALFGYGRMGHEVERVATEAGHEIVAAFDPKAEGATDRQVTADALSGADVCVDFSLADAVIPNLRAACEARRPVVIGTTGWSDRFEEAARMVEGAGIGMVYAPNFAIGVQTLFRVVAECARILDAAAPDVDASVVETHHTGKADSPSGTARRLADILLEELGGKTRIVDDTLRRRIEPDELHVVSQRLGAAPGTHTATFDLGDETLAITHTARARSIFARGAVRAAEWIATKRGVHPFSDVIGG